MKRVASLYLPHWPIDRLRRSERPRATPPEADATALDALGSVAERERAAQCSVPRGGGWRPGARWARSDVDATIARLPAHQRPPMRELGRRTEPAEHPFKGMPPDDAAAAARRMRPVVPAVAYPGEGPRADKHVSGAHPDGGRFFLTGRMTGSVVARTCADPEEPSPRARGDDAVPLVTVERVGARVVIAAASSAALALGLDAGMALTQARALVPGLAVRDADPDGDRGDLVRMAIGLARRWVPVVAVADDRTLFLDLTGVAHLHGGEAALARRLIRVLARLGVTARVAVADTAGAAWALVRYATGDTFLCPAGDHAARIATLPAAALRLDPANIELLKRLGIDSVGQLLALPRAPLVRRFGAAVARRIDEATGRAPEPLDPVVPPMAIRIEQRFAEPIETAEAIACWFAELVPRLAIALARAGLGARTLVLVAEHVDGTTQPIRIGLSRPSRDPAHLLRLMTRRIETIEPGWGIDALAIHVRRADPLAAETLGPALAETQAPDLAPLVDTLANRVGARRLWRAAAFESDVPERSCTAVSPLAAKERAPALLRADDVRRLDARAPDHPWHSRWPRPARLLHRPEPLGHVLAELPDQPPRRFTWRGRTHQVVRADGPERIHGEWWRRTSEAAAVRDYFRVEDETGQRFWLYRRGDGERGETGDLSWYMHGLFG